MGQIHFTVDGHVPAVDVQDGLPAIVSVSADEKTVHRDGRAIGSFRADGERGDLIFVRGTNIEVFPGQCAGEDGDVRGIACDEVSAEVHGAV